MSGKPKEWLHGEPSIDEMLADPLVIAVMSRYGVTPEEMRALFTDLAERRAKRALSSARTTRRTPRSGKSKGRQAPSRR